MSGTDWNRVKAIFHEAVALDADARAELLDRECGGDDRLRAEVEALLGSHDELGAAGADTETATRAMAPTEGAGSVVGRYKLLQNIGEGGFGVVYMAEQERPVRRRVALKIIKLGMDTKQVIARFEAERQALALMDHPNIAKVLDAGATDAGRPYFVMELVRGVPITEYCDRNRLGARRRLELFMAVCGAVQHAHQKGVIHRDIKPSNVMVTLHDGEPVPKIIDFGIAKATNQRLTEKTLFTEYNQFIGTPAYMSPEQAEMSGLDVDTRSDIYSLGVLLYELLTGTTPLDARRIREAGYGELQRLIREEEPHRPSVRISTLGDAATTAAQQRNTDLPGLARMLRGDLDWVVMKALEKDRTRRYETANALRRDLERFLADEPVSASPPGTLYRARKFVRRHRAAVGIGAAVSVALVAGLLLAAYGLVEARREAAASRAINAFFTDTLASVDPRHLRQFSGFTVERDEASDTAAGVTHDVSVVDMMLRARERIAESFSGKPELEATARETVGMSLLGLGRPRIASEDLAIAAQIRRDVLGPDHPDTMRSELQHALSLTDSGRAPESIPMLEELRRTMTRAYGADDPRTLQASTFLATALMSDRRHDESDPIFRETLERQTELLGPDHRDTIETRIWWANSHHWRGRGADGEALVRPAYETALKTYGPDDVQTLYAQDVLGWALNFQGKREEAINVLRPAVEGLSRVVGNEHPFTCSAKAALGRSLPDTDPEKVRLWSEAVEGIRVSEGGASPSSFVYTRDLAFLLLKRGDTEEGLRLLRRGVEDFREGYGEEHSWTDIFMEYLAAALFNQGRPDEAAEVARPLLEIRKRVAEAPDADADSISDVADDLLNWKDRGLRDAVSALRLAERALPLTENDKDERRDVLDTLALALHENGRHDEAVERQREALALLPDDDPGTRDAMLARLVRYTIGAGRGSEAHEAVRERVRALDQASETVEDFVGAIGGYSNRLAENGLHAESELARREALEIVRTERGDDPAAAAGLLYRIGRSLLHQGKPAEAERALRDGLARARRAGDTQKVTVNEINLAEVLLHTGRCREALTIATRLVERLPVDESVGDMWDQTLAHEARRLLGTARLCLGDLRGAEPPLREAADWWRRNSALDDWRRSRTESAWGECVVALGHAQEGERYLRISAHYLDAVLGPDATATRDARRRVTRLLGS